MAEGSNVNYWSLVTIVGPILLIVVMAWVFLKNKKSKIDPEITERGTRDVYAAEQREHEQDGKSGL